MPVLSTVELTMRDQATEESFLRSFVAAAHHATEIPGLLELKAYKLLGSERTYLASVLWQDEEHLRCWLEGSKEQEYIRLGRSELLSSALVRRFQQIGSERRWSRETKAT